MRWLLPMLTAALILSVAAPSSSLGQSPQPTVEPEDPFAMSVSVAEVKVLERGERPRRRLRYRWEVGQREGFETDLIMATDSTRGVSAIDQVQVPTLRLVGTIEVVERLGRRTWRLRLRYHDVGVPAGESAGMLDADGIEAAMAGLIGLETDMVVDDRGRTLQSESIPRGGVTTEMAEGWQGSATSIEDLFTELPADPVGKGAIWKTIQRLTSPAGFDVKQTDRVTLKRLEGDGLRVRSVLRQSARDQVLDVDGSSEGLSMVIDEHLARGSSSSTIDLRQLVPRARMALESSSSLTARVGKQVETASIGFTIEYDIRPIPSEAVPAVPQLPSTPAGSLLVRHEEPNEGFAVAFPQHWRVEPTTRKTHAWLYPDDPDEAWMYGVVAATGAGEKCVVQDMTGWSQQPPVFEDLDDLLVYEVSERNRDPDVDTVESRSYDFPAGRVARIDVTRSGGTTDISYWYTNGARWFRLNCWSSAPPDDRWLPIARSFEFLEPPRDTVAPSAARQATVVTVAANSPHGVRVGGFSAGDIITIEAEGHWCASAVADDCGGPEGIRSPGPYPYAEFAYGELLMQQGGERPQSVGIGGVYRITRSDRLRLFFNDCSGCRSDNRGSVTVRIRVLGADRSP